MLEARTTGGVFYTSWYILDEEARYGFNSLPQSRAYFGEIYYKERTTLNDIGRYFISLSRIRYIRGAATVKTYIDVVLCGKSISYTSHVLLQHTL